MSATASITNHAKWSGRQPLPHVRRQQKALLATFDEVLRHAEML
jgi:hypothetical protein